MAAERKKKTVGVLALQGGFDKHLSALYAVGVNGKLVRNKSELSSVDGLIIPGGESTTMTKLIKAFALEEHLT
ncbi:MAG: pyridoxal 5'-phosphate synthase glutaminase subunit PdxT, partial [Bacteroidetes bacterium]|nr:pyridoxal 5'-phosphate synthase glutaminase subunit PdxT [Bacteroidota bacterium]